MLIPRWRILRLHPLCMFYFQQTYHSICFFEWCISRSWDQEMVVVGALFLFLPEERENVVFSRRFGSSAMAIVFWVESWLFKVGNQLDASVPSHAEVQAELWTENLCYHEDRQNLWLVTSSSVYDGIMLVRFLCFGRMIFSLMSICKISSSLLSELESKSNWATINLRLRSSKFVIFSNIKHRSAGSIVAFN